MTFTPKKGSIWYDFKHDPSKGVNHMVYEILGLAINTSTDEIMLGYKALYDVRDSNHKQLGEDFYVRPITEWQEMKSFNGQKVPRFRPATEFESQEILKLQLDQKVVNTSRKPAKTSSGILLYRFKNKVLEVLIVHPGGPFYAKRDLGVWDMPKGEVESGEEIFAAALREFGEETGFSLNEVQKSEFQELGSVKNSSGKTVHIWALEGDLPSNFILKSNQFEIEWPPKSGHKILISEVDQAVFTPIHIAKTKVWTYQVEFLDRLEELLDCKNETKDESVLF